MTALTVNTNLHSSQPLARWISLALVAGALLVNPLGLLLSNLLWPEYAGVRLRNYTLLGAYINCTAYAGPPLLLLAGVMALTRRAARARPALRAALLAGAVTLPLLSLHAQVFSWRYGEFKAHAGLMFVFTPFIAAIGSLIFMGLAFLFRRVFGR